MYGISGIGAEKKDIEDFNLKVDEIKKLELTDTFTSYMRDVTSSIKSDPPSISLSNNFIDFGHAEIGCENFTKRTPQTISVTNNNTFDILITWDKGNIKKKNYFDEFRNRLITRHFLIS